MEVCIRNKYQGDCVDAEGAAGLSFSKFNAIAFPRTNYRVSQEVGGSGQCGGTRMLAIQFDLFCLFDRSFEILWYSNWFSHEKTMRYY